MPISSMAGFLLDQQLTSIVALLALSSVVVILRIIILHFLSRQQHNPSDVVTRGTNQDTECDGCISCLRSVRIVRAPPALPQPITTPHPAPRGSFLTSPIISPKFSTLSSILIPSQHLSASCLPVTLTLNPTITHAVACIQLTGSHITAWVTGT
ncbi:uncharacterized protein ARMOST_08341 [Armillaria ostoyae]|uniref:Uncharacterized protein n=1 Tax=Armillaria ostoyae TaxID=47428 RepID=A0A284R8B7_ARMOS|nr:uncharacterized protein ARMOST_08341 [Armillaria ostoyae]